MRKTHWLYIFLATNLVAFFDSLYLMFLHHKIHILHPKEQSFCTINASFNCDEVAASAYSAIAGIPVAALGMFAYLFLFLLLVTGLTLKSKHKESFLSLGWLISLTMLVFSLYMGVVSFVKIGTLCLMCILLYVCILIMVVAGFLALKKNFKETLLGAFQFVNGQVSAGLFILGLILIISTGSTLWVNNLISNNYRAQLASKQTTKKVVKKSPQKKSSPKPNQPSLSPQEKLIADFNRLSIESFATQNSPSKGPDNAPVTIVDVSDFQCGYCQRMADTLNDLKKAYPGKVRVIYKHYPLDQNCNDKITRKMHELACKSAIYSFCAFRQGKFWAFHDRIFANQSYLSQSFLDKLAANPQIDQNKFKTCLTGEGPKMVKEETDEGNRMGISYTPTLFMNGRRISSLSQGATKQTMITLIEYLIRQ